MEIQDFIVKFAEQFDETDVTEFVASTKFRELDEWSSLIALSIIAMVDEEYDVTLKGDDMRQAETIEELFNIVKREIWHYLISLKCVLQASQRVFQSK